MARLAKLEYAGPIAAKGASTDTVRARLKELHEKLKALVQDETDVKSLNVVRKQLLDKPIFLHKDKGIKAYCACCLADMLRLYAPDPPYNDDQLKDIFVFMLTQVSHHLKAQTSFPTASRSRAPQTTRMTDIPYYSEYHYLLDSLATIRSICLVVDLPGGEELTKDWFIGLFSIVRSDMNKQMLRLLQDIMTSLLDESNVLPEGVMEEVLLAQISAHKENPGHPAFLLSVGIMRNSAPKLQRQLHTYIADTHEKHGKEPSEDDMRELQEAHDMLCLLFAHAPEVLLNVVPHLEEALQGGSLELRTLTTKTLGALFGSSSGTTVASTGTPTIAESYRTTWLVWLGRRADKAVQVRVAWVEAACKVLVYHPELRLSIEEAIAEKFTDVEEKVRSTACRALGSLHYEVAAHHVSAGTLKLLGDRLRDKKPGVSERAFEALGRLFAAAYSEVESGDDTALAQFGWIPESIYKSLADNASMIQREHVESVTAEYILPLPSLRTDPEAELHWVNRLLVVCRGLSASAFESLMSLTNLSDPALQPWEIYVKACEANNGGVIDRDEEDVKKRLEQIIKYLASRFLEPHRTEKALQSFADLNDSRLYKHFNSMVNITTDIEALIRADMMKRLETSLPDAVPVFKVLANKASFWIINRSSVPVLIKSATRHDADANSLHAQNILLHVSKRRPLLFSTHVAELQSLLTEKRQHAPVDLAIQCLAQNAMVSPKDTALPSRISDRVKKLCHTGTALHGKYAARLLAKSQGESDIKEAVNSAFQALEDEERQTTLLGPLCALREFVKRNVDVIKPKIDAILERLDSKLLSVVVEPMAEDERWRNWAELDERSQTKILALKLKIEICLMGLPGKIDIGTRHQEGITALQSVIAGVAQPEQDSQESGALAGHLRMVAATGLTKMATYHELEAMISSACFEEIAFQIQDEYYPVRYGYLQKLHKYLLRRKHAPRWYILPFLVAHDVEQDVKDIGVKIIQDVQHRLPDKHRLDLIEKPFIRLLSLLAHHPDFETTGNDDLVAMSQYINLYLDEVANQRNINLLYYLANRIKTVRDIKESGDRLYLLSELAQLLLQQKAQVQQWAIDQYSGKHNMPSDIFAKLPNIDVSKEISRKQFLPNDMTQQLQAFAARKPAKVITAEKPPKAVKPRKERTEPNKTAPKRKRPRTPDSGNDTAGEETPDTDDYEGHSGEDMVVPAKARAGSSKRVETRNNTTNKKRRTAANASQDGESSELSELSEVN